MDEITSQPIGEAQPIAPHKGWQILKRVAAVTGATLGGLAFLSMLVPTRLSGANRSARLLWQNRQTEISQAIQQQAAAQTNALESVHNEQKATSRR